MTITSATTNKLKAKMERIELMEALYEHYKSLEKLIDDRMYYQANRKVISNYVKFDKEVSKERMALMDARQHIYQQMVICDAEDCNGRKGLILTDTTLLNEETYSHRTGLYFKGKYDLRYTLSFLDENYNANEDFDLMRGLAEQLDKLSEPLVLDFTWESPITLHSNGILEIKGNDGRILKTLMQIPEGFGESFSMELKNDNGDLIWNDTFDMVD